MSTELPLPSDRSFGITIAVALGLAAIWAGYRVSSLLAFILGAPAVIFGALSIAHAKVLRPLNRAWMWLAACLHRVVSPIVLAAIYFLVLTPAALLMRAMRRDELKLRFVPTRPSYWVSRDPPGPDAGSSFPRQF